MTDSEINYLFSLAGGLSYSSGSRNSATNAQLRKFVSLILETKNAISPPVRKTLTGEEIDSLIQTTTETIKTDSRHTFEHGDYTYTQLVQIVKAVEQHYTSKEIKS